MLEHPERCNSEIISYVSVGRIFFFLFFPPYFWGERFTLRATANANSRRRYLNGCLSFVESGYEGEGGEREKEFIFHTLCTT